MAQLPSALRGRRLHPLWQFLHKLSLQGMNFGGNEVRTSGEHVFLHHLLRTLDRPVVLDIGANSGEFTACILEANPTAVVHAFEPSVEVFEVLSNRFADDDRVRCWPLALGVETGIATLSWPEGQDVLASMTRRDLTAQGMVPDRSVEVQVGRSTPGPVHTTSRGWRFSRSTWRDMRSTCWPAPGN